MWREERGKWKEEREMRKVEREKRNEESGMRILRLLSWKELVISFLFPLSSFLYATAKVQHEPPDLVDY
jgi:hypothetical protein